MSSIQTAEEKELIAKWNAGDYTAEGWVEHTEGLTDEAIKGLAEYNAKKESATDDLDLDSDELTLPAATESENVFTLQNLQGSNGSIKTQKTTMYLRTIDQRKKLTRALVLYNFAGGYTRFVAWFTTPSIINMRFEGEMTWNDVNEYFFVSGTIGPASLQNLPSANKNQIVLSAVAPSIQQSLRFQFMANSQIRELFSYTVFQGFDTLHVDSTPRFHSCSSYQTHISNELVSQYKSLMPTRTLPGPTDFAENVSMVYLVNT